MFYRTSDTVVNEIFIRLTSPNLYSHIKAAITEALPLNNLIIYSLPEGLWIFCITLTSKPYYISLNNWRFEVAFFPLILCISLELLQLAHITNGRFDYMDILVSALFWLLGNFGWKDLQEKQEIFTRPGLKTLICLASYSIVYLAHVNRVIN
ncbi:hypothetical protein [Paraflavitalea pollutisoli]|uniref:hypothetical protein n=1 Tax=Paraflavitalea pollutisoli TaxID=3034143 RepID=UPI0023EAC681|nr:hypothetical protein [Paraflavitalea sp. H1-2-19X]